MNKATSTNLFLATITAISSLEAILPLRGKKKNKYTIAFSIVYLLNFLYTGQLSYVNQHEISF